MPRKRKSETDSSKREQFNRVRNNVFFIYQRQWLRRAKGEKVIQLSKGNLGGLIATHVSRNKELKKYVNNPDLKTLPGGDWGNENYTLITLFGYDSLHG